MTIQQPTELEAARAALKHFGLLAGFTGALERFEAAVRANERATPPAPMDDTAASAAIAPLKAAVRRHEERERAEHRAEVLREAAYRLQRSCPDMGGPLDLCMCHAAEPLLKWADEAQQ